MQNVCLSFSRTRLNHHCCSQLVDVIIKWCHLVLVVKGFLIDYDINTACGRSNFGESVLLQNLHNEDKETLQAALPKGDVVQI